MSKVFRSPAAFVGGALAGALIVAVWLGASTREAGPEPAPTAPPQAVLTAPATPAATAPPGASPLATATQPGAPAQLQARAVAPGTTCPTEPLMAASGGGDGRFALDAALAKGAQVEPSAYLSVARESAQHGRMRDAEVALLAACHVAEQASGSQSVPVADLKAQIAQQYVTLAAAEGAAGARDDLLQRAAALLSETAITYSTALGREASKTRLAEQRLASLHDPATLQRARADANADPGTRMMGAAPGSAQEAQDDHAGGRMRGAAGRLISSDPELAQLERDMQRLHAQARSVTRDPSGLQRRDGQALAQRDAACGDDKGCLVRWYAQRRAQLLDEF